MPTQNIESGHIQLLGIVLTIISALFSVAIGFILFIVKGLKDNVKELKAENLRMWEKIGAIEDEIKELITNYKDRFEGVNHNLNINHSELKELISTLTLRIEKQTQFCYLIQEQKKNGD